MLFARFAIENTQKMAVCVSEEAEEIEMPSTVWFGWNPTTVSAFMSKYASVQWSLHGMGSPLGKLYPADSAVNFQAAFLKCIASNLDSATVYDNYAVVCSHAGAVANLVDELGGLAADAWIRIVLQQGPPLLGKLAQVRIVACGKPHKVFVREHVLFK